MHKEAFAYVQRELGAVGLDLANTDVIELGSYIVNGSVRPLFPQTRSYTGVDMRAGHGVDVVADAATYQHDQPVGLVVTTEMLEHAPDQPAVIANIGRLLAPGGVCILTAAGVERVPHNNDGHHGVPTDEAYANVAEDDLERWFKEAGFEQVTITRNTAKGDIYATAIMGETAPVDEEPLAPAVRKRRSKNAAPEGTLR